MENNLLEEEYSRLLKGDSADLREMLAAFINSSDGILLTDKDGIIQHVNPAYEKISGYSKEDLIGKTPRIVSSGILNKKFYDDMWAKLSAGEVFKGEFINRRKNGELYNHAETITPVGDKTGKIVGFVSKGQDVTLQFYQEKKLSLFGKMASSVLLTELKDPILQIRAAAFRLRDFAIASNNLKVLKDLDIIYTTSREMEHMLGVLREFFYPAMESKDSVDIRDVIDLALGRIRPNFAKQKVVFKVMHENTLPHIKLHGKLWEFVIEELLHHYGAKAVDSQEKSPVVNISVRQVGRDVIVEIDGSAGSPVNSRGECDKTCGCIWIEGTDLKFVLMELVIVEAGGIIRHEEIDSTTFRTTLVLTKIL